MVERPRALAVMSTVAYELLFDEARRERLAGLAHDSGVPHVTDIDDPALDGTLEGVEVLITSWGVPTITAERLERMPRLRAVFHAAGTVRRLVSEKFWERNILVTSAASANAVPVAEFTLAAIIFAGKRALVNVRNAGLRHEGWSEAAGARLGNLDRTVGIVGFSRIGRRVVELLEHFDGIDVLVADPFADAAEVEAAGARLVTLDEMLPLVDVLSLHAPDLPSTRHMIGAAELAALRDGATVINTARGALIDHEALLAECRTGRIDAVLDVTEPEPLPVDAELRTLPNVAITPHVAGSQGAETRRLTDAALDEFEAYIAGNPARNPVSMTDLTTSA